jgi:hypothetical protein
MVLMLSGDGAAVLGRNLGAESSTAPLKRNISDDAAALFVDRLRLMLSLGCGALIALRGAHRQRGGRHKGVLRPGARV